MFEEIDSPGHDTQYVAWEKLNVKEGDKFQKLALAMRARWPQLTRMETRCAALIRHGYDNGQIAELFHISPQSVDNHTSSIRHKIEVPKTMKLRSFLAAPPLDIKF
jgi:DNA-binding CsgD family transcriptional regulator